MSYVEVSEFAHILVIADRERLCAAVPVVRSFRSISVSSFHILRCSNLLVSQL